MDNGARIHDRWHEEVIQLHRVLEKVIIEIEQKRKKVEDDPLIARVIDLVHQNKDTDIFDVLRNMHEPLLRLLDAARIDPRTQELSEANARAMQSVLELNRERGYTATKLERAKIGLAGHFKKLLSRVQAIPQV